MFKRPLFLLLLLGLLASNLSAQSLSPAEVKVDADVHGAVLTWARESRGLLRVGTDRGHVRLDVFSRVRFVQRRLQYVPVATEAEISLGVRVEVFAGRTSIRSEIRRRGGPAGLRAKVEVGLVF
jgi:hypothetical protein